MVKNSIVLSAVLVASFSNLFGGFLDKVVPTSDSAKIAATFLAVSAARTAFAYRVLPVELNLKGNGVGGEVKRGVGVGSYGVTLTNPSKSGEQSVPLAEKVLNTKLDVEGLTVGNVVKDAVLTAAVLAGCKYVLPAVTDSVSKLVSRK